MTTRNPRSIAISLGAAFAAMALVASPAVVAAPKAKPVVDVYTYDSFASDLMKSVQRDMAKLHGIDVRFRTFEDTGMMYNTLLQERSKPVADVVIGLDNLYVEQAKRDGLFAPYKPKGLAKVPKEYQVDPTNSLVPFDYGVVTFNYDSDKLKKAPTTWDELVSEQYKGKIVIENPMTSSPGQALLFATIARFGENGYLDYWRKLKGNLLTMTPGWSAAYGMFTNGEVPVVLSYGTSPVYHLMYEKTERYKAALLEDSAWLQIEVMGLTAKAPDAAAGKRLLEYLLDKKFQKDLQEAQFMYPVRSDVELSPNFRVAAKPRNILNGKIPQAKLAANRDKWLKDWEKAMNETK